MFKDLLNFMGGHPVLTVILALIFAIIVSELADCGRPQVKTESSEAGTPGVFLVI